MLSRREFAAMPAMLAAQRVRKPNLMVILADDMGFSDAGCYGGDVETPNIDALAARGLRFTNGYSTARCGPSRSCLMTGYYAQQTACDVMTRGNTPEWTRFAPQQLKPLGYRTYHSGKWHIKRKPLAGTGFDHSYTLIDQNRFFTPTQHWLDDEPLPAVKPGDGYYATIRIADEAVARLRDHERNHAADPFYFYLAFTSPHFPLHALQEDIDSYRGRFADGWDASRERRHARLRKMGIVNSALPPLEPDMRPGWNTPDAKLADGIGPGEVMHAVPWASLTTEQRDFQRTKMAIHAAMITRMDREIGRVIGQLKAMGAFENTLIVFLSDNGASSEQLIRADGHDPRAAPGSGASHLCLGPGWASASNTPFRLHKSWVHEGGISSPWIMHWPAGIRDRGKLRHDPCHFVDVVPTLIDMAGGKPEAAHADGGPPLAGRSLRPAFERSGAVKRDWIYFHHSNNRALRAGDWKIVAAGAQSPWELYDLSRDRAEQNNLAARDPARVEAMARDWQTADREFETRREASKPLA